MSAEPGVLLCGWGLLSKWGFNDGDEPDGYLDWLEQRGLPYPSSWHAVLRILVRERLIPLIDDDIALVDIVSSHNPIRAEYVNGAKVDWYGGFDEDRWPSVTVPFADVYAMQKHVDAR